MTNDSVTQPQAQNNTPQALLTLLHRGGKYAYLWTDAGKSSYWFEVGQEAIPPTGWKNVYFGIHPTGKKRAENERSTNETISAANCLFADFDAKDFPGGKDEALLHVKGLALPPTWLIDSGGGFHGYWIFETPFLINSDEDREYIKILQARWVTFVKSDPAAKDLARVLRVPGTLNYKYSPPRFVSVIHSDPDLYWLQELEAAIPAEKQVKKPQAAPSTPPTSNRTDPGAYWLTHFLAQAQPGNRNHAGFMLAAQLRDSGLSEGEARSIMCQFAASVPSGGGDPYTEGEALASLKSAYSESPREPATLPGAGNRSYTTNNNGHSAQPDQPEYHPADEADQEYFPLGVVRDALIKQETGDAELLARIYNGRLLFDHSESGWYFWAGHFWKPDRNGTVYSLVSNGVAPQFLHAAAEAQKAGDEALSKQLASRAAALRNKKRADNVLFLAARTPALALSGDEWDKSPLLLACENGVVNLKDGSFRPGKPSEFIRTHAPTTWESLQAAAPRWESFMLEIFNNNVDLVNFMRRLLGYGITGFTNEHILPILWGEEGRNGKGTLLEILGDRLGNELATSTQADAIMELGKGGDGPKPFLYALRGKRLVWASESNEGRRINSGLVKQLTGGDRLNVRTLHSKPVEFIPSHLLLLLTNHKPHIPPDDQAIWDRVCLIPFEVRFVETPSKKNELKRDKNLRDKLQAEAPGILAWLVRGCLEWQADGLQEPAIAKGAKEVYREEEDEISQFIAECCLVSQGSKVKGTDLYLAYSAWAKESGLTPKNKIVFGRRISKVYTRTQSMGVWYLGLALPAQEIVR